MGVDRAADLRAANGHAERADDAQANSLKPSRQSSFCLGDITMQNDVAQQTEKSDRIEETTCCIVGSGPAGAVLALLLARKGIPVMLLEEHMDFDRDFRGDTVHPSVMEIMDEIGLADRLLQLDHTRVDVLPVQTAKGMVTLADFRRLKTRFPYIMMIPQVHFLEFITSEAKRYGNFQLV